MAPLSPKGRDLIRAGRRALRATPVDRERIAEALRGKLGPEALPLEPTSTVGALRARWSFVHGAGAAGVLVGGLLLFALGDQRGDADRQRASVSPRQNSALEAPASPAASTETSQTEVARERTPTVQAPRPRSQPASAHRPERLAQEVSLMSRATSALKAGRSREALRLLEAHEQRFSRGVLEEERRGGKARVLCLLGRLHEGRAELSHLAPDSPSALRAREVCDTASRQRGMK